MSSKYKVYNNHLPYFITSTVVGWIDALSREEYKDIILESLRFCQGQKELRVHAWVIMNNHLHLIVSAGETYDLPSIIRDFKKFTSRNIISAIADNPRESRKDWMMNQFRFAGGNNNNNETYQFWQQEYHPIELDTSAKFEQRMNYLHENPVRAGIVWEPQHYKYSSAIDYYEQKQGLLSLDMF
jgi:putative transposase